VGDGLRLPGVEPALWQEGERLVERDDSFRIGSSKLEVTDRRALELLAISVAKRGDELADVGAG
jgi:hypothetical protein